MKVSFLLAIMLCLSVSSFSQDTQDSSLTKKPNTNLEKVNLRVGSIIRREFIDLYDYDAKGWLNTANLTARVLKIKDASTNYETSGIVISTYDGGSKYTSSRTYRAYVDSEEISSLIKFFEFIETLKDKTEPNYTEYIFNSKDLQFFAYYGQNSMNKKWEWSYGVEVDKYYSGSRVTLTPKAIGELKNAIVGGLSHFKNETASIK